ncbi:unnamed protein product [Prunus armeniaca]|uniref:non-specific serine/threonine protein kinase n=1 Tax=Prunus armeniaca TaxID=36596 RepID=A0A6J5U7W8_PRUAR|nr:unnamed protein product [Prunus armeniaca]
MLVKLSHFLYSLLGLIAVILVVHGQDQTGFINIDCGLPPNSSYNEQRTGLFYISDATVVDTGESSGTPFISAIELRPLNNTLYPTQMGSLALFRQYKDDVYDRFWYPHYYSAWTQVTTSLTIEPENETAYQPPSIVMSSAAAPKNMTTLDIWWIPPDENTQYHVYMHFAEVEKLPTNQSRLLSITWNGKPFVTKPFSLKYLTTTTVYTKEALSGGQQNFSISQVGNSTLPPIINAFEIYTVLELLQAETNQEDVEPITNLKLTYGVKRNWQGDPCAPKEYSWEGLNCSYDGYEPPRIISLNLSSSGLTGEIAPPLFNLTMLRTLDLSNNNLTGPVPEFVSQLPNLKILNLEKNKLTGSVPAGLIQKSNDGLLSLRGGFGTVYHGYIDDTQVAVKVLSPSSIQGYQEFHSEVNLLMRVHHRNLTSLVGYCKDGTNTGLIYEYMANGNLHKHLSDNTSNILSWEDRLRIAMDAAYGLEYLHYGCTPPIIHRDVKSTNILLNENFQAKLSDFGLSRIFPADDGTHVWTRVAGTPGYLDPEYYLSNMLNEKSDVYSFGIVLLEIITSRPALSKTHEKIHIGQWVSFMVEKGDIRSIVDSRLEGNFNSNSAWKAVEVALACVSSSSTKRPTMSQVVTELKECLAAEFARNKEIRDTDSNDSNELMSLKFTTEMRPLAR